MRNLWTAIATLVVLVTAPTAMGGTRAVAEDFVTLGDWDFVPTLNGGRVESLVALLDPSLAVGDNITAVWFRRTDDAAWQAFAWSDAENLEAIAYVKATLGLPDSSDILWPDADAQQGVDQTLAVAPDAFAKGVFADDVFAPFIEANPEPGPLIGGLAGAGYPAAAIPVQTTPTDCTQDQVLTTLAAMVEADIGTGAGGTLMASFAVPYTECDYWRSLAAPLDGDGLWVVPDLTGYLDETTTIDPATAWQSVAAGTVFGGPQTVVIDAGGTDGAGVPFVAVKLVVALQDVTPPTLDVDLLGDGMLAMVSPGGLGYFVAPVTITADSFATDNVDGGVVAAALNVDISVDCIGPGPVVLADTGYYTLHARVTDSSGNTTYASQLFEVRDRYNLEAAAAIEALTVTAGSPTDTVEATVLLTSEMFEAEDINLATLALWLIDAEGAAIGTSPLTPAPGYVVAGAYDPALVDLDAGVWRLAVRGQVPSGALAQPGVRFSITGSGLHGTPEAFDFLVVSEPFVADNAAHPTLLTHLTPMSTANIPPSPPAAPPCEWKSQFIQDDPPVDIVHIDTRQSCLFSECAGTQFILYAAPYTFGGYAKVWETCAAICDLIQEEVHTVASGGRMKVWLEPRDCCSDCEIDVSARPRFKARAEINPRATAGAGGEIAVSIPGCGTVRAAGGAAVSSITEGNFGFTTPWGGLNIPYLTQQNEDEQAPHNESACEPYEHCSIEINVATTARIAVVAESTLEWGSGSAVARLWDAVVRLRVTPHAGTGCGTVLRDGIPIIYNECSPWENEP